MQTHEEIRNNLYAGKYTKEEKEQLIQELDKQIFYHEMKDSWDSLDFQYSHQLSNLRYEIAKSLEEDEGK